MMMISQPSFEVLYTKLFHETGAVPVTFSDTFSRGRMPFPNPHRNTPMNTWTPMSPPKASDVSSKPVITLKMCDPTPSHQRCTT